MSASATKKGTARATRTPRTRAGARTRCAVDFGPEHWVVVKGTVQQVAAKINEARAEEGDVMVELERFDGTPLFISAGKAVLIGVPAA